METTLHLWEYEDAPERVQRLVEENYAGGWVAEVLASEEGPAPDVAEQLVARCARLGFTVWRYESGDGVVVLAGRHRPSWALRWGLAAVDGE